MMYKLDIQFFGGRGAKSGGRVLNPKYESFLKNGRAKKKTPEQLKVGDNVITQPVDENGVRRHEKWNFYSDGQNLGKDEVWGGDVKLTKVSHTSKFVKVEGVTANGRQVKKQFKKSEPVWTRKAR